MSSKRAIFYLLQEVAQSYIRNHRLPPAYGLSTSPGIGDYMYEYEEMSTEITPSPSIDPSIGRLSANEELA